MKISSTLNVSSKKEVQFLCDTIDDLYQIYIQAYSNMCSAMCSGSGPLIHGAPQPDDRLGIGNLSIALGIRGAKMNWALLNKAEFLDRMTALLTGKPVS